MEVFPGSVAWDGLGRKHKKAAKKLGFEMPTWNRPKKNKNPKAFGTKWDDLPGKKQRAAHILGFDEESWNEFFSGPVPAVKLQEWKNVKSHPQRWQAMDYHVEKPRYHYYLNPEP